MPKTTTRFVCAECGYASPRWLGKCPACEKFNTFSEEIVTSMPAATGAKRSASARPVRL